jgi:hypothetical protein
METKSKKLNLAWKIMLLPCIVLLIPSTLQFFVPGLYVPIYLKGLAGMTPEEVIAINPAFYEVMKLGFQGLGLPLIGLLILAFGVILKAFRYGEKWAWISLMTSYAVLWGANLVLEIKGGGGTFLILYSATGIALLFLGGF